MRESNPGLIRLSTDNYPERGRIEAVREGFGRTLIKIQIEPLSDHPFRFDATFCSLPGLGLAVGTISPVRGSLIRSMIDSDDILFNITLSGARTLRQLGREAIVGPGDGGVTTSAEPGVVTVHSPSRFISFRVPRDTLRPMVGDLDACISQTIPRGSDALSLLTSYAGLIKETEIFTSTDVSSAIAGHFRDLIMLTLGATRDAAEIARGRGVRAARLRAIKSDVLENLASSALSPEIVARRHNISPRYLSMLFAGEETSFTQFVLGCRLDRAYLMLNDPAYAGHSISAIAFSSGFGDLSYFNRTFRHRYSATPSDVRNSQKG